MEIWLSLASSYSTDARMTSKNYYSLSILILGKIAQNLLLHYMLFK